METILKELGCNPATKHGRTKARKLAADPAQARKFLAPDESVSDEQATAKALQALAEYFKANKPAAATAPVGIESAAATAPANIEKGTDEMAKSKKKRAAPKSKKKAAARKDTKRAELLRLLERANGATMEELNASCKWKSGCSNTIKAVTKKAGKKLVKEKEKGKPTRFYAR